MNSTSNLTAATAAASCESVSVRSPQWTQNQARDQRAARRAALREHAERQASYDRIYTQRVAEWNTLSHKVVQQIETLHTRLTHPSIVDRWQS